MGHDDELEQLRAENERLRVKLAAYQTAASAKSQPSAPADTSEGHLPSSETVQSATVAARGGDERFRTCIEHLVDCFGIFTAIRDTRGRITDFRIDYLNLAARQSSGPELEKQPGRGVCQPLPTHRASGLFDRCCEVVETGTSLQLESFRLEDGNDAIPVVRTLDIGAFKLGDGFAATWRDTTEQVEEQQRLTERLAAILEQSLDAIYRRDLVADQYDYMSPAIEQVTGFSVAEVENMAMDDLLDRIHPDDKADVLAGLQKSVATGKASIEYRFKGKDGEYRWLADHVTIVKDARGLPLYRSGIVRDVTEQKGADQAIRENEWRLRRLFDTDLIGMVFWNVHGGITDANAAFLKMVGYTEEDLRARKVDWSRMTPREHRHLDEYALKELRETGVDTPYEKQFIRKDGSRVWVLVGAAMFDETNGVAYVLDISRRRETEERFRTLADNIPQLAWMADRAGSIFWFNRRWYDYTGTHLHEVMGWGWQKVHHPDYVDQVVQKISHCFQAGEVWEDTFPLRGKDGTYRWFLSRAVPIRDSDGQIIRWFGTNTDVTKQRRLEEALESALDEAQRRANEAEEGKRLLDAVMEHVPEGITIADAPHVNIRMVSRFGQEMLGKPAELITNIPVDEHAGTWAVYHADGITLATGEELPLTRATEHGEQVRNEEWLLRREDGRMIPILCNAGPIRGPSGEITGGIIVWRDISELRQARAKAEHHMEELEEAIAEAEAANRAKDHFLAVLSHELRTPLMPVLGITSFMLANPALPKAFHKDIEMIRRNVELEAKIIDDLLDVTRIAAGKVQLAMECVDVHALIHQVMTICQSEIEAKAIQMGLQLDAEQYIVQGDSTRLQQVLWNLIRNAVKFTPEHGRITVRTICTDDQMRVEVEDTGRGIDPQMLPKIFDAFEQGGKDINQRFGGLGLGLAISKGIVEVHGGSLTAFSAGRGKGARFTVELSVASASSKQAAQKDAVPLSRNATVSPKRVLLVEDHEASRTVLARLLCRLGHDVEVAGTMKAALETAASTPFDLVISDIGLPDGLGTDLMRTLRERYGLRGVALTGYGAEADLTASRDAGFDVHLTKPVAIEKLEDVLANFLA